MAAMDSLELGIAAREIHERFEAIFVDTLLRDGETAKD